jgi:hypothetical protein
MGRAVHRSPWWLTRYVKSWIIFLGGDAYTWLCYVLHEEVTPASNQTHLRIYHMINNVDPIVSLWTYIPYTSTGIKSSMEGPKDTDEALIPTQPERLTGTLKCKVCKKTVLQCWQRQISSLCQTKISQRERSQVFSLGYQSDSILRLLR